MFNLTADMLRTIVVLEHTDAWPGFIREFEKIRTQHMDEALHYVPDQSDINAHDRQTLMRGVAIALDVLYHTFCAPLQTLEDMEKIEKRAELDQTKNPF